VPGRIVLVTGANRGIGREVVRQLGARRDAVLLGSRDPARGERAAAELGVPAIHLDVTDPATIAATRTRIENDYGRLDVLVNNAAIDYDTWQTAAAPDFAAVRAAIDTNLLGAWETTAGLLPLLRRSEHGRIVNVSSEAGSMASMGAGTPAYSVSKAGLNALTRVLADELRRDGILVNAVCPGWVATDMGGPGGRPVADGAASVIWAIDLPDGGPTGGFYRDSHPLAW
jgi:NAD(P)-dependent dehydrogenase (short-subunit alcohol dehydrogenase family)